MLGMSESEIYKTLDHSAGISKQINAIVSNRVTMKRITTELDDVMNKMYLQYRNVNTEKAIAAFRDGHILLCYSEDPTFNLPVCIPFFKYAKDGKIKVVVNITNYLRKSKIPETDNMYYYDIKPTQLYTLLVSAYLYFEVFTPKGTLKPKAAKTLASLWANMALKPLNKYLSLKFNKDKFAFYRYAFAKFFLIYYLQIPEASATDMAMDVASKSESKHNPFIIEFESSYQGDDLYTDYNTFMKWILAPKFTAIKTGKLVTKSGVSDQITPSLYMKLFIDTFDFINVSSLMGVPYFMFTLLGTYNKAFFGGDRAMEDIVFDGKNNSVAKLLNDLD